VGLREKGKFIERVVGRGGGSKVALGKTLHSGKKAFLVKRIERKVFATERRAVEKRGKGSSGNSKRLRTKRKQKKSVGSAKTKKKNNHEFTVGPGSPITGGLASSPHLSGRHAPSLGCLSFHYLRAQPRRRAAETGEREATKE